MVRKLLETAVELLNKMLGDGVDGYSLDCYDYLSTCRANKSTFIIITIKNIISIIICKIAIIAIKLIILIIFVPCEQRSLRNQSLKLHGLATAGRLNLMSSLLQVFIIVQLSFNIDFPISGFTST